MPPADIFHYPPRQYATAAFTLPPIPCTRQPVSHPPSYLLEPSPCDARGPESVHSLADAHLKLWRACAETRLDRVLQLVTSEGAGLQALVARGPRLTLAAASVMPARAPEPSARPTPGDALSDAGVYGPATVLAYRAPHCAPAAFPSEPCKHPTIGKAADPSCAMVDVELRSSPLDQARAARDKAARRAAFAAERVAVAAALTHERARPEYAVVCRAPPKLRFAPRLLNGRWWADARALELTLCCLGAADQARMSRASRAARAALGAPSASGWRARWNAVVRDAAHARVELGTCEVVVGVMLAAETTDQWAHHAHVSVRDHHDSLSALGFVSRRAMVEHARDARVHVAEAKEAKAMRDLELQAGMQLQRNPRWNVVSV